MYVKKWFESGGRSPSNTSPTIWSQHRALRGGGALAALRGWLGLTCGVCLTRSSSCSVRQVRARQRRALGQVQCVQRALGQGQCVQP
jgi:hypothetical protein